MALVPTNLIELLINAQILNGIITPILLTFVLVLADRKRVLGEAANGPIFRVAATVCVAAIAVMAGAALVTEVGASSGFSEPRAGGRVSRPIP